MAESRLMIYGAYGYSGKLIVHEAVSQGLRPVLAGRDPDRLGAIASKYDLEARPFALDEPGALRDALADVGTVLHCAGPFSRTSAPMLDACLATRAHYLDITGEVDVFVAAHERDRAAREAGIVVCPGVGFDVIPTDSVAHVLAEALPDATRLSLGFDSRSVLSPGTAQTAVEGLSKGGRVREKGVIREVGLAWRTRRIDFGRGEKNAMTIPWGDVATAHYTTGIPNIDVYIPASPRLVKRLRRINLVRPLFGLSFVQRMLKARAARETGPDDDALASDQTWVWGEAENAAGDIRVARLVTANGYALTATGSVAVARYVMRYAGSGGYFTPSRLVGADLVTRLPGSGDISVS